MNKSDDLFENCFCGMDDCFPGCGCEILTFLGRKWSVYIIMHLQNGKSLHFNNFLDLMKKLGPKSLSKRLKEAESLDLIKRTVKPSTPVEISYALTKKGNDLGDLLRKMKDLVHSWGIERKLL